MRQDRQGRRGRNALALTLTLLGLPGCTARVVKPSAAVPGAAAPSVLCADFSFSIYFEKGSDDLTDAARSEIGYAAARVRGCKLGSVAVLGLADRDGAIRSNLILSKKRAQAVARALAAGNLPAPRFDVQAMGEEGAVTPEGDPEPLRRRVDVVIRASPAS